ncbi:MAG: hypothetical protein ACOCW2_03540 [Chitinivibrionales bacterium]
MKHRGFVCLVVFVCLLAASAGAEPMVQPRRLIDSHTAGLLPRGHFDFETRVYPSRHPGVKGAGITFSIGVGITDRLMFGGGYGADGLVGRTGVKGNPLPGLLVKYRVFEETIGLPGVAIGYDWQGYGGIEGYGDTTDSTDAYRGYVYKSQGFFLSVSKNYLLINTVQLGFHSAINYSLEQRDEINWPNGYIGMDLGINEELAIAVEYDLALNHLDPETGKYANPLKGFLNAGVRWRFAPTFYLEFDAKDILQHKLREPADPDSEPLGWGRELKLVYYSDF